MQAEKLTLANFCQHRFKEIEFQPGLTAIIGPNGSGKSNILGAMKYAMTGDHPNVGGKDANVRQGTPESERSYVEFTFSHGNVRGVIVRRNLKPASPTTVMVNNEFEARGDRAANEWICDLLATDAQILNDIVIVDQEDIFGFLSQLPAKRAASFAKLFHTDAAEAAWKAIGNHLSSFQIPQLPVDLGAVTQALETDAARVAEIASVTRGDTSKSVQDAIYQQKKVMADWAFRRGFESQLADLRGRRLPLMQQHTDAQEALAKANLNVRTLQEAAEASKGLAEESRVALALLARAQQHAAGKLALKEDIERTRQELAKLVDPEKPLRYDEDLDTLLQTAQVELLKHRNFVESFDPAKGTTECPTCGTAVESLRGRLDEARTYLPALEQASRDVHAAIVARNGYNEKMQRIGLSRRGLQSRLDTQQMQYDALELVTAPPEPEDTLRSCVVAHDEFVTAIATYQKDVAKHTAAVAGFAGQLQELDPQIEATEAAIAKKLVTEEQANVAQTEHAILSTRWEVVGVLERELIEINTRMQHNQRLKEQCAATAREIEVKQAWVARAQRMRDVLHRDAAPKIVAQRNLARLQQGINEQLEMFAAEYRISSDLDLSFVAHFNDGREQPAARLSAGQKVILALSFRLAVSFMYADLGFLVLDEPTAYLDEHHIAGFEPVLGRLREFAASRGLQCLMVTHEQSLAPLFDSVFQL